MTSEGAPEAHLVIWGTDVNVQETKKRFREFLMKFVADLPSDGGEDMATGDRTEPYYLTRLEEVCVCVCVNVGGGGVECACEDIVQTMHVQHACM